MLWTPRPLLKKKGNVGRANTWTHIANTSLGGVTGNADGAAIANGSICIWGGFNYNGYSYGYGYVSASRYDPGANTFTSIANNPSGAMTEMGVASFSNGCVLLIAGMIASYYDNGNMADVYQYTNQTYRYDPIANTYTRVADYPTAWSPYGDTCRAVRLSNDSILTIAAYRADVGCYNPGSNSWTRLGVYPYVWPSLVGAMACSNNNVYFFNYENNFVRYDVTANTWTILANSATIGICGSPAMGQAAPSCFNYGNDAVMVLSANNAIYTPSTNTWNRIANNEFNTYSPIALRVIGAKIANSSFCAFYPSDNYVYSNLVGYRFD